MTGNDYNDCRAENIRTEAGRDITGL